MTLTFRRTGQVYQRHPINGAGDGVISNVLAKETLTSCAVFDAGTTGQTESDRDKVYKSGAFVTAANYLGRYVRVYNTPPTGSATSTGRTGFRHEDHIYRIKAVDGGGNYIQLEGARFEDTSTAVSIDIFAAADFTAASAVFTANAVGQAISFPNAANRTLQLAPFRVGLQKSGTTVLISDLFGVIGTMPTESTLKWYLKDRPAYATRDFFYIMMKFILDCGWTLVANRGRWLAGQTTGVQRMYMDDMVFESTGENGEQKMYLRMSYINENSDNDGTDGQNRMGFSFALYAKWDPSFVPTGVNADRGNGAGINSMMLSPNSTTGQDMFAAWDRLDLEVNQEMLWNPDETNGSFLPDSLDSGLRDSWFSKTTQYSGFIAHPMRFPMGGTYHEINYVMFGDKDEIHIWAIQDGVGISTVSLGGLKPLPSQIQKQFTTTAITRAGSNVVVRVGTVDPTSVPSGPNYQVGDNFQIVGQTVNPGLDWNALSHAGEFIETAFIQAIAAVGAVGRITCVAKASLVDNTDTFTIDDGEGNNITFYYDVDGAGGGAGTAINVSGDTTAAQVATTTAGVINGSALNITATPNGAFVDLVHNTANSAPTNVTITEAVNDAGFLVYGMEGSGYGVTLDVLANGYAKGALAGEDPQPMFMASPWAVSTTPFNSTVQNTIRLSNRARHGDVTYYDHNGQSDAQNTSLGFSAILQPVPVAGLEELDPSSRTNRFGLLGVFARDTNGNQWRGRLRYFHILSKRVRPYRFIRDRDGNYYFTLPPKQNRDASTLSLATTPTLAIGPMPASLAIPA